MILSGICYGAQFSAVPIVVAPMNTVLIHLLVDHHLVQSVIQQKIRKRLEALYAQFGEPEIISKAKCSLISVPQLDYTPLPSD